MYENILGTDLNLNYTKEKNNMNTKSGIYRIDCNNCEVEYYEKRRKNIGIREKE